MKVYERAVRFEEVDVAKILFFARYLNYAHEALERFFDGVEGGYAGLTMRRGVGFPAVRTAVEHEAPLRYGDVARIEISTAKLGNRSATLRYRFVRAHDGVVAANVTHVVVTCDLERMTSCDMPADVRRVFEEHLET